MRPCSADGPVHKQVELHYPSHDVPAQDTLKMQLSYDNEKFTSEWIMLNDGYESEVGLFYQYTRPLLTQMHTSGADTSWT